jgi:hypothetical protein
MGNSCRVYADRLYYSILTYDLLAGLTSPHLCAYPKPGPGFLTSYVMVRDINCYIFQLNMVINCICILVNLNGFKLNMQLS